VSLARYEILLPQKYNDGSIVAQDKFEETWFELLDRFGAMTAFLGLAEVSGRTIWSDTKTTS
jgi:hypothetical protein